MVALKELFATDVGLISLFVLLFLVGMAVFFVRWFGARIREDEAAARNDAGAPHAAP